MQMKKLLIPLLLAIMLLPAVVQAQLTLPYTTGFEGLTTGQLPTGWSQLQSGSSGSGTFPAVYEYASNARNGSVYFEFESTTGQTELAALPVTPALNAVPAHCSGVPALLIFRFQGA